jgi:hypothetical protein
VDLSEVTGAVSGAVGIISADDPKGHDSSGWWLVASDWWVVAGDWWLVGMSRWRIRGLFVFAGAFLGIGY